MTKRAQFSALPLVSSVLRSTRCRHAVFASCLLVLIFCFLYFFTRSLTGKLLAWKKKLEFAIRTSPITHLFCPPKCCIRIVFTPRSIGMPVMPRRHQSTEAKVMQNLAGEGGGANTVYHKSCANSVFQIILSTNCFTICLPRTIACIS